MSVANAAPPPPPSPYEYSPEKCDCNCKEAASTPDGYENEQAHDGFQTDDLRRSGGPHPLEDDNDVNNSDSVDDGQQHGNGTTMEGGYEEKNRNKRSTIGYGRRYGRGINPHYLYSTLAHHYNKHYGRFGSLGHYGGYGGYGRGYGSYGGFGHHRGYGGYGHHGGYGGYGHYSGYGKNGY